MTKVLCIYHANCADGLGAAWAVHRALGDGVEFVAASYGDMPYHPAECSSNCDIPDCPYIHKSGWDFEIAGRDILIVDFSYTLPVLRAMATEARSVLVLDHHKTAREDLASLPPPCTTGIPNDPKTPTPWECWLEYGAIHKMEDIINSGRPPFRLAAIFDMERSGAGIVWDYLHPAPQRDLRMENRPRIIDLIEDRDLWRFRYEDSRPFHAVLSSYDWTDLLAMFRRLSNWQLWYEHRDDHDYWNGIIDEGRAILRAQQQDVAATVRATRRTMRIADHVVPVANVSPSMASEAGHLLCQENYTASNMEFVTGFPQERYSFAATYHDGSDGRRHFSLRSPKGGADVGEIAKRMAVEFNEIASDKRYVHHLQYQGKTWTGGGHEHAAGFDAPLGWEGE